MKLERAKPEDAQECISWLTANPLNDLSPPTLEGALFYKIPGMLYLPVKLAVMLDSLAPNPEVTGFRRGRALLQTVKDLQEMYPSAELIFLSHGKDVMDYAAEKLCGFEPSSYLLYRWHPRAGAGAQENTNAQGLAEIRLRNNARAVRRKKAKAARIMPDMLRAT